MRRFTREGETNLTDRPSAAVIRGLPLPAPSQRNGIQRQSIPGQVAQLVEQGTENPRVGGSIPSLATKKNKGLQRCKPFFLLCKHSGGLAGYSSEIAANDNNLPSPCSATTDAPLAFPELAAANTQE